MKIYLIRHGLTPLNKQKKVNGEVDEPLATEGIEQAKAIISFIPKGVTHIYSSSLLRAKQTANIIISKLNIPVSFHDELSEVRMGSLAGKSWEQMDDGLELKKKHRTVQFNYRPYGGESVEDVKKRLIPFFKKINAKHKDNEALIITHGAMIRLIYLLEHGESIYETEKHVSLLSFDLDKILKH
ncbi:MAG: histidine phosphatase family protein [bacterium]|nr:histidine phosphatase family protein [bacterium]